MLKFIISAFLFLLTFFNPKANSQNIVPNPSFETVKEYPCSVPVDHPSSPIISTFLVDWYAPSLATSDAIYADTLYSCSASLLFHGVASMHSGKMCAGIFLSEGRDTNSDESKPRAGIVYREYIQTKLKEPLKVGKVYRVDFFVHPRQTAGLYSNNIGALFTTDSLISMKDFGEVLAAKPQVVERKIIKNTQQWQKVSGCFTADSAYNFLTLGNFFTDDETAFSRAEWNTSFGSYLLIDDVSVVETDISELPKEDFLGPDITLCKGDSITYTSDYPWVFQREDGTLFTSRTLYQEGMYAANLTYQGCVVSDSVTLTVVPPIAVGKDTLVCDADQFVLKSNTQAIWPDGSVGAEFTITESGTYRIESASATCPSSTTIKIELVACPGEIPNAFSPNGDGVNDYFVIPNLHTSEWELEIHNRWGKLIYHNKKYDNRWDGGKVPAGNYFYLLRSRSLKKELKGWVIILR